MRRKKIEIPVFPVDLILHHGNSPTSIKNKIGEQIYGNFTSDKECYGGVVKVKTSSGEDVIHIFIQKYRIIRFRAL